MPEGEDEQTRDIDWQFIEDELREVPEEFKEQRFYPLKHVVEIFSSGDPQHQTAELHERESRLAELVDTVVEGYHVGFTRSIQNYSQILTLFQDARSQMDTMKHSINDSIRQLSAHSRNLGQQWQRSRSLSTSLQLLRDVHAVVGLPAKINQAVARKDWPSAVSLLLEACSRLARDEMRQVEALRKLRAEMADTCRSIQRQMCEQLLALAYDNNPSPVTSAPGPQATAGRSPILKVLRGRAGHRSQGRAGPRSDSLGPSGLLGTSTSSSSHATTPAPVSVDATQLAACLASLDTVPQAKSFLTYSARAQVRSLMWRAAEAAASAAAQSYHAATAHLDPVQGMGGSSLAVAKNIEVLAQKLIQGVADACMQVLLSLATVLRAVADAPQPQPSAALDLIRAQLVDGGAGGLLARNMSVRGGGAAGTTPAQATLEVSAAKRDAYVRAEVVHVWMQMQEEWHTLLSQLLHSQLRALGSRGAQATKQPKNIAAQAVSLLTQPLGWLQKIDELGEIVSEKVEAALGGQAAPSHLIPTPTKAAHAAAGPVASPGRAPAPGALTSGRPAARALHFTLDIQVSGLSSGTSGVWSGGGPSMVVGLTAADTETAQGYSRLVHKALGEQSGSVYLTPAIYLPLSTFVDAALTIMKPYLQPVAGVSGARARRLAEQSESAEWLREGVEDFVLETFLPQIWMDLRARCTTALEHPDAFRPPAQALSTLSDVAATAGTAPVSAQLVARGTNLAALVAGTGGKAGSGKGVVAVARFAERMLQDIASWTMAMPAFESSFMGVGENILGRMLDSFWLTLSSLAGSYQSFRLALRYDVAVSQALELDHALLGPTVCFCVSRAGPGAGSPGAPNEVDMTTFLTAVQSLNRPELVPTTTGRAGLVAVASHQGSYLLAGLQSASEPGASGEPGPHSAPSFSARSSVGGAAKSSPLSVGVEAELELQLLLYHDRPSSADQLMSRGGANTGRLVAIAALGESLEFIADAVVMAAHRQIRWSRDRAGRGASRTRRGRGRAGRSLARDSGSRAFQKQEQLLDALPESLLLLVQRCKLMAGICLRTLRIELMLQLAYALHNLTQVPHIVEASDDAREVLPQVGSLLRSMSRVCEDLSAQLAPGRLSYVMAGLAPAAARMTMWLLSDIQEINSLGVDRMVRTLSTLQPALIALAPSLSPGVGVSGVSPDESQDAEMRLMRMRAFDRARGYYQLLSMTCEEVLRLAAEKPMRFGYGEWAALLQVHVLGRTVTEAHTQSLHSILDRAHGLTAGQKIVGAVGTVLSTVITAPEKVADVALDVLKLGAEGLVAGARLPARQLGKVFRKLEAVARDVTDKVKRTP